MASTSDSSFFRTRELLERCAQLVAEAYEKPPSNWDEENSPSGISIFNRRQRYFVTETDSEMFVSMPGTTHPLDWGSNMNVGYQPVLPGDEQEGLSQEQLASLPCAHTGFLKRSRTVPALTLHREAAASGKQLIFTGHSLGGAVAAMCTLELLIHLREAGAGSSRACEVQCRVFATPIWANACLARFIEDQGWGGNFVNVTVPEDYCLKLFNNVLTSAAKSTSPAPSPSPSSTTSSRKPIKPSPFARQWSLSGLSTLYSELTFGGDGSEDAAPNSEGCDQLGSEDSLEPLGYNLPPNPTPASAATAEKQQQQQEAGEEWQKVLTRKQRQQAKKQAQQLRWNDLEGLPPAPAAAAAGWPATGQAVEEEEPHPGSQTYPYPYHSPASAFVSAVEEELNFFRTSPDPMLHIQVPSTAAAANSPEPTSSRFWGSYGSSSTLPSSPSASSLSAMSLSSTRSWRLFAYLPGALSRSISMGSMQSWGSSSSLSRSDSIGTEGGLPAGSSAAATASTAGSSSSSSSSTHLMLTRRKSKRHLLTKEAVAAAAGAGTASKQHICSSLGLSTGAATATATATSLLRALPGLRPLSLAAQRHLISGLIPYLWSSGRSALGMAKTLADKALGVPLDVVEAGLIQLLQPPMYTSVGQQWVLTASGLLPQQQPIEQYPCHPWDVFWHRELTFVAFRQHSINFYKQRLVMHAHRR